MAENISRNMQRDAQNYQGAQKYEKNYIYECRQIEKPSQQQDYKNGHFKSKEGSNGYTFTMNEHMGGALNNIRNINAKLPDISNDNENFDLDNISDGHRNIYNSKKPSILNASDLVANRDPDDHILFKNGVPSKSLNKMYYKMKVSDLQVSEEGKINLTC